MPREKINDQSTEGWYTEVSWRRRPGLDPNDQGDAPGHVQIATVNPASPFEFPEKDTGEHFEAAERFDGWRVTLDDEGIKRLIKSLHRARWQAFGPPAPLRERSDIQIVGERAAEPWYPDKTIAENLAMGTEGS